MSPALADLPVRRVERVLKSLGFEHVRTKGSHAVWRHQTVEQSSCPCAAPSSGARWRR
ncbi:type II toxin-antitoxin system HicA family toxin [Saccharothrix coeruleofusca]|uniref:type II toxin-antitoxin system HicA family toxin n=1 Tax=Saccharothrix coeruleofusca TaxID=33919 RepID=UPI0035711BB6